jgi:hypothetical protein
VDLVQFLLVLVVLAAAVTILSGPLRRPGPPSEPEAPDDGVAALEAAREAKYREIRELELDFKTGKLSEADFEALDGSLRAEAVEILKRLDRAHGASR